MPELRVQACAQKDGLTTPENLLYYSMKTKHNRRLKLKPAALQVVVTMGYLHLAHALGWANGSASNTRYAKR